ncbi:helix-turn-helix transcriptional regulator [Gallaecimonas xiamenensis]|uniref:Transcriptional regulator n=1 Tax=Gallaecimonas xiamenensis 3-C-1 TaxID=745411 RepID=K2JD25_9GAMM|nr:metalloregulator ArsR/SmtB family transcription factor [Gallaecimonas xiamenensis]EKE73008.1 transcriptional regulator [Gallaecimonas xiamenensis 3-C-1]
MPSINRILYLLKTRGEQTAQVLAADLGMTAMGARQHLLAAEQQGLVESFMEKRSIGRPARVWRLTEAGHARFPERHADLTLTLIEGVKSLFGDNGLDALIGHREQQMREAYRLAMAPLSSLAAKVERLAELRSAEGYMAEVEQPEEGRWLLIENHCPICTAAQHCQQFCRSELALFNECFAGDAKVSRTEHLLADGRRCVYLIEAQG